MSDSFEKIALRQSIIREQWLPLDAAIQEAVIFEKRFGPGHFLLACHAALPSQLTPELLHFIRLNFLDQKQPPVPWTAEMDFLLSPLCRAIGEDLFEVEPTVREALLDQLEEQYGWRHLQEIAHFLLQYLHKTRESKRNPGVAQLHEWIALSYLEPTSMIGELRRFLIESIDTQRAPHQTLAKRIRFARTVELLAEPLARHTSQKDYYDLIHSARALAYVLYGNQEKLATTALSRQPSSGQSATLFPPEIQEWLSTIAAPQLTGDVLSIPTQAVPQAPQSEEEPASAEHEEKPVEQLLQQAGWVIQSTDTIDVNAAQGIVIREFPLDTGYMDYLLVVDGEAVGVIEVKRAGLTLTGIKEQITLYRLGQPLDPTPIRFNHTPLPFSYEATNLEIIFTNNLEPEARSRRVFHFHRPETLALWLKQAPIGIPNELNNLLRSQLRRMPALPGEGLHKCQYEALTRLEESFAKNRPRALVQMATGSGKSYMAVNSIYRLLRFGGAKRILFLVDRTNLALQALNQFQQYVTPDTRRKFTEFYKVQHLRAKAPDPASEVCITTIQRLYSILTGKSFEAEKEEESLFEQEDLIRDDTNFPRAISYNPAVPIEFFDMIFIDECHRSIYNEWRPALEYFDAFLVGLTSTIENRAFAFFNRNLVYEYSLEQAVADGIAIGYKLYSIRTRITEQGSRVESGNTLWFRNKETRARTYELITDDLIYEGRHLDYEVTVPDQIRTVIRAFKDALFTDLFPDRQEVPKTVIFAKNDIHADDIVKTVCEEFAQGNDFAKKITYRVPRAVDLIYQFSNNHYPRIAVSIDMISTGIDIKPLEVLLFMRPVRSRTFFEQMIGRGSRTIDDKALHLVSPGAHSKTHFVVVDAVGITDGLIDLPLKDEKRQYRQVIDDVSLDQLIRSGFEKNRLNQVPSSLLQSRFTSWLENKQRTREQPFTSEQIRWLERIRDRIATDLQFKEEDFERSPFQFEGGRVTARYLFGQELSAIIQELNETLVK